jgi:hypothetical protein
MMIAPVFFYKIFVTFINYKVSTNIRVHAIGADCQTSNTSFSFLVNPVTI